MTRHGTRPPPQACNKSLDVDIAGALRFGKVRAYLCLHQLGEGGLVTIACLANVERGLLDIDDMLRQFEHLAFDFEVVHNFEVSWLERTSYSKLRVVAISPPAMGSAWECPLRLKRTV
jgi:hypothetical protein